MHKAPHVIKKNQMVGSRARNRIPRATQYPYGRFDIETGAVNMLPSAIDAERAVVGGMLVDRRIAAEAVELLNADDFYSHIHQTVFKAVAALFSANRPIDPITVSETLRSEGTLSGIGGTTAISNLPFGLPFFDSIGEYARIVREKSVLRQIIRAGGVIQNAAFAEDGTAVEILERAATELQDLTERAVGRPTDAAFDISRLAAESLEAAESFDKRKLIRIGLKDLDRLLGGLEGGTVTIIGARPSAGKTALATQVSLDAAKIGNVVLLNSLEMSGRQCMDRLIASEARVNLQDFRSGNLSPVHKGKAQEAAATIGRLPIVIDDGPELTLATLKSRCRRIRAKRRRLDLVVVDYLQLMRSDGRASHQDNRRLEIEMFTRGLKLLAMEFDVPVVCLSQLSRAPENRRPPKPILSDLRESGSIEQDADVVILIYRPDQADGNALELIVAKHRNGPTGVAQAHFLATSARFEDLRGRNREWL